MSCMAGGGHAWHGHLPPSRYYEIRSMRERYASYWNAFLFPMHTLFRGYGGGRRGWWRGINISPKITWSFPWQWRIQNFHGGATSEVGALTCYFTKFMTRMHSSRRRTPAHWPYRVGRGAWQWEGACVAGGMHGRGVGCAWQVGMQGRECVWQGACKHAPLWTEWQTRVKTLPCRKLRLRAVEMKEFGLRGAGKDVALAYLWS